ncbi:MAG: 3-dehydroquinate synthase [Vicinamibacterales bacterium]
MNVSRHGFSVRFDFPVYFTRGAFSPSNPILLDALCQRAAETGRRHRVFVVIDGDVAAAHPGLVDAVIGYAGAHPAALQLAAPPLLVPGGEAAKNDLLPTLDLLRHLHDAGMDRQSFVVVIGGGAVLDMASFAAALCHRSVRVVRFPTTVLAQADSGVAVKNGINLFNKKNFIGTFVPPFAVVNDSHFIRSLDRRDVVCGVVEAVKVSLLRDPELFAEIERQVDRIVANDPEVVPAIVRRSAELHLAHICGNGDPFELGSARPLDFGHWAAHKLEALSDYRLRHGEAVAIGMALDLCYAVRQGFLDAATANRVLTLFGSLGLALWDPALDACDPSGRRAVLTGLQEFREHLGGQLHVTMLRGIGRSFEVTEMDDAVIQTALADLAAWTPAHLTPALKG